MNCEQVNKIDLVDYLSSIGYETKNIRGNDYWYLSPLRDEKEPSFKVNRSKNVWYDHGLGIGGTVVDFAMKYYQCDIREALQNYSFFHVQESLQKHFQRPPFHSYQKRIFSSRDTRETVIRIIAAKKPIEDPILCRYLEQRKIEKIIADRYCYEVQFTNGSKEKTFTALGFKNNAGGYELRNEFFKGSSSPKYVTYEDNKANNLSVFEGFFDFMSYQTLYQHQQKEPTNFLVLNSLSFFERSLLLMEKHKSIHLYLDRDEAGRKHTRMALKRSPVFKDESKFYKQRKDLNDWLINVGPLKKQKNRRWSVYRQL